MIKYDPHPKIAILINSIYYFLGYVYILKEKETYRLIVIHNHELLANRQYKTIRGAKIAFSKEFGYKAYKKNKPLWSPLYHPIQGWHEEHMQEIKS